MRRENFARWTVIAIGCLGLASAVGCSDDSGQAASPKPAKPAVTKPSTPAPPAVPEPPNEPVVDTRTEEELVEAGRVAFNANCIACHAMDPTQDGALGPAVSGSSLELLQARVLRSEYPEGYTPKRPSRLMVPLPHLEPRLPELAAYLNSF